MLDVRNEIAADTKDAIQQAPLERANASCGATIEVDGLGDTCRTSEGLLRVELDDGTSFTTHGADAPPLEVGAPHLPASQAAVSGATKADIACVPTSGKHVTLVYARPSDRASRYATIKPLLQTEMYRMSAFIDAESQSVDGALGKRVRMRCDDDGSPTVLNATLPALGAAPGASFSQVVNGLKDLGYDHFSSSAALERYIVYYDAPSSSGAAGTGHLYEDSTPNGNNMNNKAGMYAVEYRWEFGDDVPHWDVLLHEAGHNMGALSDDAPHSSGAGHCNDGLDIMCYNDGGPAANYVGTQCSTEQFDCHRDDYFNPAPAAGSYLATHWNAAANYNSFLQHDFLGDSTPPSMVPGVVQTGASNTTIGVAWGAATDDKAVTSYQFYLRPNGAAPWTLQGTNSPSMRRTTVTLLAALTSYQFGIRAFDAAGNGGAIAVIDASTSNVADVVAPGSPSRASTVRMMKSVKIRWADASDDVGVAYYEVLKELPTANPAVRQLRSAGTTPGNALTVPGLAPGRTYTFRIVAHDDASNASAALRVTIRTLPDRVRPSMPTLARVAQRGRTTLRVAWRASRDNVGVRKYYVYQLRNRRWLRVGIAGSGQRALTVRKLRRSTSYRLRVRAVDAAGNLSTWSNIVVSRTR